MYLEKLSLKRRHAVLTCRPAHIAAPLDSSAHMRSTLARMQVITMLPILQRGPSSSSTFYAASGSGR
jgi:hypothetical protein